MKGTNEVKVGVGVFIVREGSVLLGKRHGSHGAHTWALPGGHLQFGESIQRCAQREVLEETGIVVDSVRNVAFTNDVFTDEHLHYVTLFVMAEKWSGQPAVLEPAKCMGWSWFDWADLPTRLFLPLRNLIKQGFVLSKSLCVGEPKPEFRDGS
ncbi:MAG: NUDIX hydrolase [Desulfobacteraceae bacterium]|nr:NUDIX hydrolase [Desulfobacteraceae bacterium]